MAPVYGDREKRVNKKNKEIICVSISEIEMTSHHRQRGEALAKY